MQTTFFSYVNSFLKTFAFSDEIVDRQSCNSLKFLDWFTLIAINVPERTN